MRPRPFGRGIRLVDDLEVVVARPSMRPRPFGRGIAITEDHGGMMRIILQ